MNIRLYTSRNKQKPLWKKDVPPIYRIAIAQFSELEASFKWMQIHYLSITISRRNTILKILITCFTH